MKCWNLGNEVKEEEIWNKKGKMIFSLGNDQIFYERERERTKLERERDHEI